MMQKLDGFYLRVRSAIMAKLAEEDGINTIELVVILAMLVAVAVIFGNKLSALLGTMFDKINTTFTTPT